ncbi:hypothetical protein EVA_20349, partial [gut metagenome]
FKQLVTRCIDRLFQADRAMEQNLQNTYNLLKILQEVAQNHSVE